ncbi:hypothetical protein FGK63_16020 [Ruegeria sediminis]|uniref:DUF885 domain-containing protein n=1 Tax=Ruegeria sediminis TaxID=2583820 RepID=A0ABY2WU56_9RHOB|nr:hypothetical protein [Ruegeria sediminis]TMV05552.1 hypothetical protein FGK63_16020 [Ruegeria sediminis]
MKTFLCTFFALVLCLTVRSAWAQDFSADFNAAYRAAEAELIERFDDADYRSGLMSLAYQLNASRVEKQPAGYETDEWLSAKFEPLFTKVGDGAASLTKPAPLPDEQLSRMAGAFAEAQDAYAAYFVDQSTNPDLLALGEDGALRTLAAFSTVAYNVDAGLWDGLFSITGFWPFCAAPG